MTDIDFKMSDDQVLDLLNNKDAMAELLTGLLNQVLEARATEIVGAERHERSESRQGYRNGYRERTIYTRVGSLTLRVPQLRDGSFCQDIFKRYQRNEQALVLSLMELYLQGVSTRKVAKITETLCGTKFSKSTVSRLCAGLDARVSAWRDRSLADKRYPFLLVDALVIDIRRDEAIRASGALIVFGINEDGQREPLDCLIADSETEASWNELFKRLKSRGLKNIDLVVSDAHTGLVAAVKKNFQGATWQRCQTHFMRNILGRCPRHVRGELAEELKAVFQAPSASTARQMAKEVINRFESKATDAIDTFEEGLDSALTILTYPTRYRKRLRTTNLAERTNEEIRRRQRVIRIFPNEDSALRLIGAMLADLREDWLEGNRYLDMTEYWDWCKETSSKDATNDNVVKMAD